MELGAQTWQSVDSTAPLLVPLGSTEQHGPHLPLDTDARIADAIARGAASRTGAVVAPVLPYGASGEHAAFAGTLSIGTDALQTVVVELVRSAFLTFGSAILVNGHGGNLEGVRAAVKQLVREGHDVSTWVPVPPPGVAADAHAGRTETSLMLAIAPELVRLDLAEPGTTTPLSRLMTDMRAGGVAAVSPNGILGDPTGASRDEGRELLDHFVSDLEAVLQALE